MLVCFSHGQTLMAPSGGSLVATSLPLAVVPGFACSRVPAADGGAVEADFLLLLPNPKRFLAAFAGGMPVP